MKKYVDTNRKKWDKCFELFDDNMVMTAIQQKIIKTGRQNSKVI